MHPLPPQHEMYAALLARDETYDGLFFVGVRTTGIFCRPVCMARKPKPENVEYFVGVDAAESAGYRACKRCDPLSAPGAHPEWVARLLALLEASPDRRLHDADLAALGVQPARARRYFRARFGMTFQAWQRARRLGVALDHVNRGAQVGDVAFGAGFESESGFRDAFARIFGEPPGRARGTSPIVATVLASPIGPLIAAATSKGVCLLEFADRKALKTQAASLQRWFRSPVVPGTNEHLDRLKRELDEYFRGQRTRFEVALAIEGTPFQRAVWTELAAIPFGETRSYEAIAIAAGVPNAQRAVGLANGKNRLSILLPCHRVIQKSGELRGYGGGLWRKRWLLEHECEVARRESSTNLPAS